MESSIFVGSELKACHGEILHLSCYDKWLYVRSLVVRELQRAGCLC